MREMFNSKTFSDVIYHLKTIFWKTSLLSGVSQYVLRASTTIADMDFDFALLKIDNFMCNSLVIATVIILLRYNVICSDSVIVFFSSFCSSTSTPSLSSHVKNAFA